MQISFPKADSWCRMIKPNVGYYQNQVIRINDIDFILSTLWTDIPLNMHKHLRRHMNDFRYILYDGRTFNTDDCIVEHKKCFSFIKQSVAESTAKHIVVVTLHLPTQICVVHQIRNSCKYVVWKEKKEFTADLKNIYNAPTKEAALLELDLFEQKWGAKYPYAIRSWRTNWDELTSFFDFPIEIRKIIYTTNLIENLNGKIR